MRSALPIAVAFLLATLLRTEPSFASTYSFTKIAGTSGGFSTLNMNPRLNSAGQVVFYGAFSDGTTGVYVGSGGPLTTIALNSGPLSFSIIAGSVVAAGINDSGVVAFSAALDSSPTVPILVKGSGVASPTTVYDTGTTTLASFGAGTAMNASELLSFYAILDSGGGEGIFAGSGGPHVTIAGSAAHHSAAVSIPTPV